MTKNTRWSTDDFKKAGLIQVENGDFKKSSSQVVKNVKKIEPGVRFGLDVKPEIQNGIRPKQVYDAYKKTGVQLVKAPVGETFLLPNGQYVDVLYRFIIEPVPAPRMTQSDKWKTDPTHIDPNKRQRKPVENYFKFKRRLMSLCEISGYKLTETLNIIFVVPFPKSYNAKKRAQLDGKPHDQKPDIDNFSKCWMDSLSDNDREVWNLHAIKVWGYEGMIIIF